MNNSFKFLGILCLIVIAIICYDKYNAPQEELAYNPIIEDAEVIDTAEIVLPETIVVDNSQTITNDEFGYKYSIPSTLKLLYNGISGSIFVGINDNQSRPNTAISVSPIQGNGEMVISQMSQMGAAITDEGSFTKIQFNSNGISLLMLVKQSPNGNAILLSLFSLQGINEAEQSLISLAENIEFSEPSWSLDLSLAVLNKAGQQQNQDFSNNRNEDMKRYYESEREMSSTMAEIRGMEANFR